MQLTAKQYAQGLRSALIEVEGEKRETIVTNFLRRLYAEGKLKMLAEIVRHIELLEQKYSNVQRVRITSAHEHSDEEVQQFITQIISDKELVLEKVVDTNLIGGIRIETADKRWDLSVHGQLQSLIHRLHN